MKNMADFNDSLFLNQVKTGFMDRFGHAPMAGIQSPGRINLLGEHIDYHGGHVLPAAVDLSLFLAYAPNEFSISRILALDTQEYWEGDLCAATDPIAAAPSWLVYFKGMVQQCLKILAEQGIETKAAQVAQGKN
ncbi:MAG: galactokinase family protein, partial [Sphingobacteriia bacterium]